MGEQSKVPAQVVWPDGQDHPSGLPDPIRVPTTNGATVIQWTCGPNVASFQISGLDPTEFTPPASNGWVTVFTTTDRNDQAKRYDYTVSARHTDGRTASHDPRIENGSGK